MNKELQGGYLEIIFAHRNKNYGAYELRKNYDKRMLLSGLLMCSLVLLFIGWNAYKQEDKMDWDTRETSRDIGPVIFTQVDLPKPKEIAKPKEQVAQREERRKRNSLRRQKWSEIRKWTGLS